MRLQIVFFQMQVICLYLLGLIVFLICFWSLIFSFFLFLSFIIGYSVYHFIAKFIFKGKAKGSEYFRALSGCFILYWFTFIPLVGIFLQYLVGLWLFVLNIFILMKVHKLEAWKAILVVLIPLILLFVVGAGALFNVMAPTQMMP